MPSKRHSSIRSSLAPARASSRKSQAHLSAPRHSRSNTSTMSSSSCQELSVAVQPPVQARAGTVLYPPLVVRSRTTSPMAEGDASKWQAMAVLVGIDGNVLQDFPATGTTMATGMFVPEGNSHRHDGGGGGGSSSSGGRTGSSASSSRPGTVAFIFPGLVLPKTGDYKIRVDVWRASSTKGFVGIGGTETGAIAVYDVDVAVQMPSSNEGSVLQKLYDLGFEVPGPPN